jgi:hypothetical protein
MRDEPPLNMSVGVDSRKYHSRKIETSVLQHPLRELEPLHPPCRASSRLVFQPTPEELSKDETGYRSTCTIIEYISVNPNILRTDSQSLTEITIFLLFS